VTNYSFNENTPCPYRSQHFVTVITKESSVFSILTELSQVVKNVYMGSILVLS